MTRPLRIEFPGALYHVTSRGDRRKTIFIDDADRERWIEVVELVCKRFNFVVHAYCQMGNHYHLIVETIEGNLAQGMRQLNSLYSQEFNRSHGMVGHVLQGRYKAILVQKESYLLELARYVVLNPVRAGLERNPEDWKWSSYWATLGLCRAPPWLSVDGIVSQFGATSELALQRYRQFIVEGIGQSSPLEETRHQIALGDEAFVAQHAQRLLGTDFTAVVKKQRRVGSMTLDQYRVKYSDRDEAMFFAYRSTAFTMVEIAMHFGVSYKTVGRAVRRLEKLDLD